MQYFKKLLFVGFAALMLCVAVASSAFAVTAYNQSTGVSLSAGEAVHGAASNLTLTGTFFSLSNVTITCSSSTVDGTVTSNPDASGNVLGDITSLTFSGCSSTQTGTACNPTANIPSSNPMKLLADTTTSVRLSTPTPVSGTSTSNAYVDISSCLSGGTCHVGGGNASGTFGTPGDVITNYLTATWSNTSPQLRLSSPGATVKNVDGKVCTTNGIWTASYQLTLPGTGNALVGLH